MTGHGCHPIGIRRQDVDVLAQGGGFCAKIARGSKFYEKLQSVTILHFYGVPPPSPEWREVSSKMAIRGLQNFRKVTLPKCGDGLWAEGKKYFKKLYHNKKLFLIRFWVKGQIWDSNGVKCLGTRGMGILSQGVEPLTPQPHSLPHKMCIYWINGYPSGIMCFELERYKCKTSVGVCM